jgi:hypothetical protein
MQKMANGVHAQAGLINVPQATVKMTMCRDWGGADWTNHHIICIGIYYLQYQQSRHIVILTVACGRMTVVHVVGIWNRQV